MKKSKILAAVMLLAMFSSIFAFATVTIPAQSGIASAPESDLFTPDVMGDPMGVKGILAVDAAAYTIVGDGDLAEWDGLIFESFNGVNVSLAFDSTYVYVGMQWADETNDIDVGQWNKSGLVNDALVDWNFIDGADDVIQIGFTDGTDTDIMVWTASNRTNAGVAFECNATGHADVGTLPYEMNTNITGTFTDAKPLYDSDWVAIPDEFALPNGTMYDAWHDVLTNTATASQTDTDVYVDWNNTKEGYYTVEMIRLLDTTRADDFDLDFSTEPHDLFFEIGSADEDDTFDMLIPTLSLNVTLVNDAASLTFTEIAAGTKTEALVITGGVFDDFVGYTLLISMDGWEEDYGPFSATVNDATGNWSFLFFFDEYDMPLGEQVIFVTLDPKYEDPIQFNQTIVIDDIKAPTVQGLVDIDARYPDGVPAEDDYVTITVGLDDDYCATGDIAANLNFYEGSNIALATVFKVDMVQFAEGSTTFVANMTIEHVVGAESNYTYFVTAWDTNLNKVTSVSYNFTVLPQVEVPAFGIIAGLFGLVAAVFIVKKVKKRE